MAEPNPLESNADQVLLYDYPRAPSCQRVRIGLALKGVDYEIEPIDIRMGARNAATFRVNSPQGFVPVLRIDGLLLRQSLAILEYVDETRGGRQIIPVEPVARSRVRRLAQSIATASGPLTNLCVLRDIQKRFGPDARRTWLMEQYSTSLSQFEASLHDPATGDFCHGDEPTLADCVFAPHANAAWRWGMDLRGLPRVSRIFHRCLRMPEFAKHLRDGPEWQEPI
ncbi:MAG: maleylacetoacetate isomerase [Marivita sp.]|uniref:maleylacetoacetate isomerase n=1 Tax=Marivita sp. TaxID=2003365 RepID=UPI001B05C7C9|nr:maleylacetoacetate isomerase [Marivita sp.]MBO6883147.1 maleylacetoacetate isomerase [Marivita sp.]